MAAVALLILNGASWWVERVASNEIRTNFVSNLGSMAELLAHQVRERYEADLVSRSMRLDDPTALPAEDLVPPFETWLRDNGASLAQELASPGIGSRAFHDLYLLDARGALAATASGDLLPNSGGAVEGEWYINPALEEDDGAVIRRALAENRSVSTDEVFQNGIYSLTLYAPLSDLEGSVSGLVGVRAHLLFGDRLVEVRRKLVAADLVGSALVILLAFLFYRASRAAERAEARMREQERLAQLGEMVSIVAHEIRNPLGIIEQTAEVIRRKYDRERTDEMLQFIPEEVERLSRIVTRFLEFARPDRRVGSEGGATADLVAESRAVHGLLAAEAERRGIVFEVEGAGSVPIGAHADAVRQILLNLLLNALDATAAGKRVVIRVEEGGVLVVRDEGCGMDEETLKRAGDPFFTTKEKGSGLGLALVKKLVLESGAEWRIESVLGQGTNITIVFNR